MFKKILVALAVLTLALALVACGGTGTDTTVDGGNTPAVDEGAEHVHNFVEEITPATCVATGKIVNKCACGEIESGTEIAVADHTASALDCDKDTVCTVCNTVLAAKTGHNFSASEVVTPATCSAAGKEKGTCVVCGKVVETEIPATGHVVAQGAAPKAADGGFAVNCASCGQAVTLKATEPAFKLVFDDVAAEAAGNALGLEPVKTDKWKIQEFNGSKALYVNGTADVAYINVPSAKKLAEMGMFVISFDYMSTKEAEDGKNASVFSILGNFYNGGHLTVLGETKWGWAMKLVETTNVLATKNSNDTDASNSIAIERNKVYKIDIVVVPDSTAKHVFVDGTYIGNGAQGMSLSTAPDNYTTFRFGDGPECGHVFDNFVVAGLK